MTLLLLLALMFSDPMVGYVVVSTERADILLGKGNATLVPAPTSVTPVALLSGSTYYWPVPNNVFVDWLRSVGLMYAPGSLGYTIGEQEFPATVGMDTHHWWQSAQQWLDIPKPSFVDDEPGNWRSVSHLSVWSLEKIHARSVDRITWARSLSLGSDPTMGRARVSVKARTIRFSWVGNGNAHVVAYLPPGPGTLDDDEDDVTVYAQVLWRDPISTNWVSSQAVEVTLP